MITRRTITSSSRILHSFQLPATRIIGRRRNAYGSFVFRRNASEAQPAHTLSQDYTRLPLIQFPFPFPFPPSKSSPSFPIQPLILQQRRYFGSIPTDDENDDKNWNDTTTTPLNLPDDTHSGDPPSSKDNKKNKHKKSKADSAINKKRDASPQIQMVQLQDLHSKETIREHFAPVVKRNDVSRLKWISTLKNQLKKKKVNLKNSSSSNVYMTHTQTYLQKQSKEITTAFWDLILVTNNNDDDDDDDGGAGETKNKKAKRRSNKKSKQQQRGVPTKSHVDLLQEVRQAAVEFPILWSVTRRRKMNVQNQERRQDGQPYPWKRYLAERSERLATIHNAKSKQERETEARQLAEHLYDSMPDSKYERLMAVLQDHAKACEQEKTLPPPTSNTDSSNRLKRIQVLYNRIRGPLQRNIHLVAADLGDYLYVTVEDDGTSSRGDIVSDPRICEHSKAFEATLDNFVDSFAIIHEFLWKENQSNKRKLHDEDAAKSKKQHSDEVKIEAKDDSEEAVLESFQDVMSSGTEAAASKSKKKKAAAKRKPRTYVLFEAINLLQENEFQVSSSTSPILPSSTPGLSDFPSKAPTERLVIVDNLPIDVNENMLMDTYSRCGPIESIAVFNKKPHLDPGRRSVDSKKKIRNPSSQRERWIRPRTPLYAMILFADAKSAQTAASDPLRIFGMVLDRHLIRSYGTKDLTKLYLEDIAGKHDIAAIEYELSQILHPELYVCLDIDGDQRANISRYRHKRKHDTRGNCIIQFQDFEAAYWSYLRLTEKLNLLKNDEECALQWIDTPKDAMLYWTRKLNF
ncbi:MAG: hypothetical protein SGBAC_012561 [Bacillariaceae sp.]